MVVRERERDDGDGDEEDGDDVDDVDEDEDDVRVRREGGLERGHDENEAGDPRDEAEDSVCASTRDRGEERGGELEPGRVHGRETSERSLGTHGGGVER